MENIFTKTQNVLEKSLNASSLRWNVLLNNVANANTPNFKRSDVTFNEQLKRALLDEERKSNEPVLAKRTSGKHIPFHLNLDYKEVQAKIQTEFYNESQNNGNNVDMAFESSEASKTQLLYNATIDIYKRNYKLLSDAIK